MTELTGFVAESAARYSDDSLHLSAALGQFTKWAWPPVPKVSAEVVDCTQCEETSNLIIYQFDSSDSGFLNKGYSQDWYDTIHILPSEANLGNLLSSQERSVAVWNAYFTPQSLASITPTGDDGLTLSQPTLPPTDYAPLEPREYLLSVSTNGPAVIQANYIFNFTSDSPELKVTGNRVTTFTFQPNWVKPVIERLEWRTQVIEHEDGSEQVIKLRQEPRKVFEYQTTLQGVDRQIFNSLIWGWQSRVYALPVWTDASTLSSEVLIGDTTVLVNTVGLDFYVGGLAIIIASTDVYEVVEIGAVTETSLTTLLGTRLAWPKYTSVIAVG